MFRKFFGRDDKNQSDPIGDVYSRLRVFEELYGSAGLSVDYRKKAPPELVARLYLLSNDAQTTVHLIRVLEQRQYCEHLNQAIDPQEVIDELGAKEAKRDAMDHYDSAKKFCDHIVYLGDTGQISRDQRVGVFLEENLGAILAAAATYSMKFSPTSE